MPLFDRVRPKGRSTQPARDGVAREVALLPVRGVVLVLERLTAAEQRLPARRADQRARCDHVAEPFTMEEVTEAGRLFAGGRGEQTHDSACGRVGADRQRAVAEY